MKIREILILADHDQPSRFRGIARFAGEHGWQLRVEDLRMPPHRWQGDGALVTLDGTPKLRAFARELLKRNIPVVDMVENESGLALPRVTGNNHGIVHFPGSWRHSTSGSATSKTPPSSHSAAALPANGAPRAS